MSLLQAEVTEPTNLIKENNSKNPFQPEPVELDSTEDMNTTDEVQEVRTKQTEEPRVNRALSFAKSVRKNLGVNKLGSVAQEK